MKYATIAAIAAACLLPCQTFAQEDDGAEWGDGDEIQLISSAEHLQKTGWGAYRNIAETECSVQTTQNGYTLSFSFPNAFLAKTKIASENWNFTDMAEFNLNILLKTNNDIGKFPTIFKSMYGANYIEAEAMDAVPFIIDGIAKVGIGYQEYIVDFEDSEDIRIDMRGLNEIASAYAECSKGLRNANPAMVESFTKEYSRGTIGDQVSESGLPTHEAD